MLYLQRASAGSGKTYTLAYTFIRNLITDSERPGRVLLRTDRQLADSLTHILAITFTNKATNEMKLRIVEKLAALADTSLPADKVDYLADFMRELKVSREELADTCARALALLLNNYSDFHVSTIDSFFQSVLRTFAYEAELNDTYQVELNTAFIDRAGIDAVLDEVNTASGTDPEAEFWIRVLMRHSADNARQWNLFQRSDSSSSVYSSLTSMLAHLDKEDFRIVKEALDDYFERNPDFRAVYTILEKRYADLSSTLRGIRADLRSRALLLLADMNATGAEFIKKTVYKKVAAVAAIIPSSPLEEIKPVKAATDKWPRVWGGDKKKSTQQIYEPTDMRLAAAFDSLQQKMEEYNTALADPFVVNWQVYRLNFAYLGLLQRVGLKKREFLESNNLMELGATTTVLGRIIGDSDTPFVYERLGTRLKHYLIDEFQDTSRMQWHLLSPLLHESHDRGYDNLIIGDAKQSIYRFRNADYSLITDKVPAEFDPPRVSEKGLKPSENTNWRSDRGVVMWNNVFFKALSERVESAGQGTIDISDIYVNVAQPPRDDSDTRGYVEVRLHTVFNDGTSDAADSDAAPEHFGEIPQLIRSLLARGYRQRDIALLVRNKKTGQQVIDTLISHNTGNPSLPPLEFVSEQSLTVGNSKAVRTVIAVLESIARGIPGDPGEKSGFPLFAIRHPELSPAERLRRFMDGAPGIERPDEVIADMQAVALPALVEAIIEHFVPQAVRRAHTPFLAALQDIVTDYCQSSASDIPSFLKWWEKEGADRSISSPEGADAIQIMTIHKSKGLEFRCVIIPESKLSFAPAPQQKELVWIRPQAIDTEGVELPPYLPVETGKDMELIGEGEAYRHYLDLFRLDALNTVYVAYTRAVSELYILGSYPHKLDRQGAAVPSGRGDSMTAALADICDNFATHADALGEATGMEPRVGMEKSETPAGRPMPARPDGTPLPAVYVWKSGTLSAPEHKDKGGKTPRTIADYPVNGTAALLQYREAEAPPVVDDDPEADPDPRSLGNLLHAVMAGIGKAGDLDRSLLAYKVKGLLDRDTVESARATLREALGRAPEEWFDGSMRVMNERPLLTPGHPERRPDRVMVAPDGRCVVVDYKFGLPGHASEATLRSYRNQVSRYARMLHSTGRYTSVEAWLWHVPYDAPVRVEWR